MNLRDGVLAVRQKIGELQPNFFSDAEIIVELNTSARRMCSAAQSIMGFSTFNTRQLADGDWAQEYALSENVDQLTGVAYYSGALFPLMYAGRDDVQLGGYVPGLPQVFYLNSRTRFTSPQVPGGSIEGQPINPNAISKGRLVLGLWPVPQAETPVYLWYISWHPNMENALDECEIPDRFKQAWISYAAARMKEKESAIDEAQYYEAQHEKGTVEYIEYMSTNQQEMVPPRYSNRPSAPYNLRGSSVMVVIAQSPGMT